MRQVSPFRCPDEATGTRAAGLVFFFDMTMDGGPLVLMNHQAPETAAALLTMEIGSAAVLRLRQLHG